MTMLALLALLSGAHAASNQVSAEIGWFGAYDPNWDWFSSGYYIGTFGLRGGLKVHDRVTAIVGWHHGSSGAGVYSDYDYDEGSTVATDFGGFHTKFVADQITLGAKADWAPIPWVQPYAAVQAVGMRGVARFDDDTNDDENATQTKRAGVTGGVLGTVGSDFPIRTGVQGLAVVPYVEVGYAWLAPMKLGDAGDLSFYGFSGRAGLGLHF